VLLHSALRVSLTIVGGAQKFQACYELNDIHLLPSVVGATSSTAIAYTVLLRWSHKYKSSMFKSGDLMGHSSKTKLPRIHVYTNIFSLAEHASEVALGISETPCVSITSSARKFRIDSDTTRRRQAPSYDTGIRIIS
jgi:hypothetical protein